MDNLNFNIPWHKENSPESLENQLYREVGKTHKLFSKKVKAIARRQDMDDVLFFVPDINQFVIVHLTWATRQLDDKDFPSTEFIINRETVQKRIDDDVKDWDEYENTPLNETGGFIKGKMKIIIVGASSGIGREMAKQYALDGNLVAVTGRRVELLENLKKSFGGRIIYSAFDITKDKNTDHLQSLVSRLGGLDILVISAGGGDVSKELDWQLDKLTVDTNVNGFVEIANWGFNYFIKQNHGSLATISSIASLRGNSWAPAYSASKAFQSNYFEGLSIKAARMKKEISVTCIEPGFVDTHMAKGDKKIWVIPVEKAARRIITAIEKKKRKSYLSIRWWFVGKLLKLLPYWLLKKIG